MRDRARLAYTVYVGEIPGAQARKRMDRDGDGTISDRESRVYADELAARVAADLEVSLDGASRAVSWAEIDVGMGMTATGAGSFSVDLIAWVCSEDRAAHRLVVHDRYRIPRPGETELRVQESPGITITRSALGADSAYTKLVHEWQGNDGPMAQQGLVLDWDVDREVAMLMPASECGGRASVAQEAAPGRRAAVVVLVGLLIALGAAVLVALKRKRQKL